MACFWIRWHVYALSATRIRPPSCYDVACRVRGGTHDMHDLQNLQNCLQDCLPLLTCGAPMFIVGNVWSLNIRSHFSVTEYFSRFGNCLQMFGRLLSHLHGQTCDFDTSSTIVDHITFACG